MIFPVEYQDDLELSADELDDKYNPDGDGEHPLITRADWRIEVANEYTISGYWNWLAHRFGMIASNDDEQYELETVDPDLLEGP